MAKKKKEAKHILDDEMPRKGDILLAVHYTEKRKK